MTKSADDVHDDILSTGSMPTLQKRSHDSSNAPKVPKGTKPSTASMRTNCAEAVHVIVDDDKKKLLLVEKNLNDDLIKGFGMMVNYGGGPIGTTTTTGLVRLAHSKEACGVWVHAFPFRDQRMLNQERLGQLSTQEPKCSFTFTAGAVHQGSKRRSGLEPALTLYGDCPDS
ncbi:hypothetical protein L7F22_040824 [Adiantum nelumboides]|nr:hypothetical protein [Adiantum nelumboides]